MDFKGCRIFIFEALICSNGILYLYISGQSADREVYLNMKHGVEAKNYQDVSKG